MRRLVSCALAGVFLAVGITSCSEDSTCPQDSDCPVVTDPETIGPIYVEEIVGGYWQDNNHAQGICFIDNALVVSCSKQLIKWNLEVNGIVDERRCSDIPAGCEDGFHYGDISEGLGDLWVAYHEGPWEEDIDCSLNRVARFKNGVIDELASPVIYYVDYQGHIGALEVVEDKLYVSGKFIPNGYASADTCFNPLVIYVYDIDDLGDSSEVGCNSHSDEILVEADGKWGTQALARLGNDYLLVAPYRCTTDAENRVYQVSLTDGYPVSVYSHRNWGYGFTVTESGDVYVCEDNRYDDVFLVKKYQQ